MILTCLVWQDAATQPGPLPPEEFHPPPLLVTAGILAKETDEWVAVAMDFCEDDGNYRDIRYIPKEMIRHRKDVTIKLNEHQ